MLDVADGPLVRILFRPLLTSAFIGVGDTGTYILIDSEQPESEQAVALWHETLHLLGLKNEDQIEAMARRLANACPEILPAVKAANPTTRGQTMNTAVAAREVSLVIGRPLGGGFYAGSYMHGEERRALIVAPKAGGKLADIAWNRSLKEVAGALSYFDGLANTEAMAAAGSELAKKVRALRIGGFDDWHLPALDQLEIAYRALKPGTRPNYLWARSGINLSSVPPAWPYTAELPAQTDVEIFRAGGAEAFEEEAYWTSTQLAANSEYAWFQFFDFGTQYDWLKDGRLRARAVRSIAI